MIQRSYRVEGFFYKKEQVQDITRYQHFFFPHKMNEEDFLQLQVLEIKKWDEENKKQTMSIVRCNSCLVEGFLDSSGSSGVFSFRFKKFG